jgi:hypothetical protein
MSTYDRLFLSFIAADINLVEKEWKIQFAEWSNKYIVDWKHQFDNFLRNHEKRLQSCTGGN